MLPKAQNRPLTPTDMKIPVKTTRISIEVIMDGRVMRENFSRMGKDANWLTKKLTLQGHKNAKEIFLGVFQHFCTRLFFLQPVLKQCVFLQKIRKRDAIKIVAYHIVKLCPHWKRSALVLFRAWLCSTFKAGHRSKVTLC